MLAVHERQRNAKRRTASRSGDTRRFNDKAGVSSPILKNACSPRNLTSARPFAAGPPWPVQPPLQSRRPFVASRAPLDRERQGGPSAPRECHPECRTQLGGRPPRARHGLRRSSCSVREPRIRRRQTREPPEGRSPSAPSAPIASPRPQTDARPVLAESSPHPRGVICERDTEAQSPQDVRIVPDDENVGQGRFHAVACRLGRALIEGAPKSSLQLAPPHRLSSRVRCRRRSRGFHPRLRRRGRPWSLRARTSRT